VLKINLTKAQKVEWFERIEIEGQTLNCKLDPGADATIMPLHMYEKLQVSKSKMRCPLDVTLVAFEGSKAKPVGVIQLLQV